MDGRSVNVFLSLRERFFEHHLQKYADFLALKPNSLRDWFEKRLCHDYRDGRPIEPIWNRVKRDFSPRDADNTETFRNPVCSAYNDYTERMSFVTKWIERCFGADRLRRLYP